MFKIVKNLSAPIVKDIFENQNNAYDLQNPSKSFLPTVQSAFNGIENIS